MNEIHIEKVIEIVKEVLAEAAKTLEKLIEPSMELLRLATEPDRDISRQRFKGVADKRSNAKDWIFKQKGCRAMKKENAVKILKNIRKAAIFTARLRISADAEKYAAENKEALDMAIEALQQQDWIPCSERLPEEPIRCEETEEYNVTIKGAKTATTLKYWGENEWSDGMHMYNVIAWQPLPEPYKGE